MAVPTTLCGKVRIGSSDIAGVTAWRFPKRADVKTYNSSSTSGHVKTLPGPVSGEVGFDVIYDPADDIYDRMKVNDLVTLLLYVDGTIYYSASARVSEMSDEVNVAAGEAPTVACTAITDGAWTYIDGTTSTGPC